MARQETADFLTAFAIGTVLGVGATLLLRSGREADHERLIAELRPLRKRAAKQLRRARAGAASGAHAAEQLGGELLETGRSVLSEFREEVADIVSSARDEIIDSARHGVKRARRKASGNVVDSARDTLERVGRAARRRVQR
jgi:gas vesicle protein